MKWKALIFVAAVVLSGLWASSSASPNEALIRKFAICHHGETIRVSVYAVRKHQAHGDCIGACGSKRCP